MSRLTNVNTKCCLRGGVPKRSVILTMVSYWKCWQAKFEKGNKAVMNQWRLVDGLADDTQIAEAFAKYFKTRCASINECLRSMFNDRCEDYVGFWMSRTLTLNWLRMCFLRRKEANLQALTIEQLVNSQPVSVVIYIIVLGPMKYKGPKVSYKTSCRVDQFCSTCDTIGYMPNLNCKYCRSGSSHCVINW